MENKKTLKVNCAVCDVRHITEELLNTYAQVKINAAVIITNHEVQALLGRYGVKLNAASTLNLDEDVRFTSVNGSGRIFPGQTIAGEKVFLIVNGSLEIEPGSEEVLKNYAGIMVNGSLICPESMTGLLSAVTVNGATKTYPDGAIRLKNTAVLDRFFHLRAKQDALYYASSKIVALASDINFGSLAEKNVRFVTRKLLVSESLAEAAVPLFDEKTDIVILPDGCAYVSDDAELNGTLIKRYGGKLYVDGRLSVTPDSAYVLDQVAYLRVNGNLRVCRSLKDRVLEMDMTYDKLRVVGGVLICDRPALEITASLLSDAEDGVSIVDCANVTIAEDVTPELLKEQLVSITDSIVFCANKEQMSVVQALAVDCSVSYLTDADEDEEEAPEDENTVKINAAVYTF